MRQCVSRAGKIVWKDGLKIKQKIWFFSNRCWRHSSSWTCVCVCAWGWSMFSTCFDFGRKSFTRLWKEIDGDATKFTENGKEYDCLFMFWFITIPPSSTLFHSNFSLFRMSFTKERTIPFATIARQRWRRRQ